MTIKEMEARTGLPRANIRYYESQGFLSPARGENGYRDYSQGDLDTLMKVKLLRQLRFSLEDIHALQAGELELDQALTGRLQALEEERTELDQAAWLCREMQGDGARYDTLDAPRYLQRLSQADRVLEQDRVPGKVFPWRRYFARTFDFFLYSVLFHFLLQLLFHENVVLRSSSGAYVILDAAITLAIMLAAETLLLHFRGATPGKALLGLRIVREDGSFLSLAEAAYRTVLVVFFYAVIQIPLIGTALLICHCWCVYKGKPLAWESEEQVYLEGSGKDTPYWEKRSSWLRLGGYGLSCVLLVGLLALGQEFAMTPAYRGDMTVEQFVSNYNQFSAYLYGEENLAQRLTPEGVLEDIPQNNTYVISLGDRGPDPSFSFTEEAGVLTAVTISRSFQNSSAGTDFFSLTSIPYDVMTISTWALLCGRPGISRGELKDVVQTYQGECSSFRRDLDGAEIDCSMEFQGYIVGPSYLLAQEGQEQSYDFSFTITLA